MLFGYAVVENGDPALWELHRDRAVTLALLLQGGEGARERVGADGQVRLVGADLDTLGQVSDVDLPALGLGELVACTPTFGPTQKIGWPSERARVAS